MCFRLKCFERYVINFLACKSFLNSSILAIFLANLLSVPIELIFSFELFKTGIRNEFLIFSLFRRDLSEFSCKAISDAMREKDRS